MFISTKCLIQKNSTSKNKNGTKKTPSGLPAQQRAAWFSLALPGRPREKQVSRGSAQADRELFSFLLPWCLDTATDAHALLLFPALLVLAPALGTQA